MLRAQSWRWPSSHSRRCHSSSGHRDIETQTTGQPVRLAAPTVFLSYHYADADEVDRFVERFGGCFGQINAIGVTDGDDFVVGCTDRYVMERIKAKYIRDASLTIVLLGNWTWTRRFVDWEIAATLSTHGTDGAGVALLALDLPGEIGRRRLPLRLENFFGGGETPERCHPFPQSIEQLLVWVNQALQDRASSGQVAIDALLRRDLVL